VEQLSARPAMTILIGRDADVEGGASGVTGAGVIRLAATLSVLIRRWDQGMAIVFSWLDKFMSEVRALTNITATAVPPYLCSWGGRSTRTGCRQSPPGPSIRRIWRRRHDGRIEVFGEVVDAVA